MTNDEYRAEQAERRQHGLKARQETRLSRADLTIVRQAIELLPAACQYHGDQLVRDYGWDRGSSCCETGAPALARRQAEAALERLEASA